MPATYLSIEDAKHRQGLRMVVVAGLPSPWSEAAKGILHIKNVTWTGVYLDPSDNDMAEWTGSRSAPVIMYNDEPPRPGWGQILLLAERLSPEPSLLPLDPATRAQAMGFCHEICGEMGLGWVRRLNSVHNGLTEEGGFPKPIAQYLAQKYGYQKQQGLEYEARVISLLNMLAEHLHKQRDKGEHFYIGATLSAVDIYSATFMAYFKPLAAEHSPMPDSIRSAFESMSDSIAAALDPILIEHRDFIYSEYLGLPPV